MTALRPGGQAEPLGADHGSLAYGVPPSPPGTIFALPSPAGSACRR
ncbi:hypothetical protein [Amycolatopsis sp. FDAARGOS 1241]|nr:hypothetical protein [Amycolatopsis sp. FDAARGOS 1241]